MRIDAHQHFWTYSPDEYDWIDPTQMAVLAKTYGPDDLIPHLATHSIDGSIAVQARQDEVENSFLLGLASRRHWIRGVVGWVDLAGTGVETDLERLAAYPRFKGVRHVAQGEPPGFLLRDAFVRGVSLLHRFDLVYEILVYAPQVREAIAFVDRCPAETRFVLDHLGKPRIAAGEFQSWQADLQELARRPNVSCKLSGLVTEADLATWTPAQLLPYIEAALEAFGAHRLMYGSDWPVCRLAGTYDQVHNLAASALSTFSETEQAAVFGMTASRVYRLEGRS